MSLYYRDDSGLPMVMAIMAVIFLLMMILSYVESHKKLADNSSKPQTNYVVFVTNYIDVPTNNR